MINSLISLYKEASTKNSRRSMLIAWAFVAPALICALLLRYYPLFQTFYLSFFDYDFVNPPGKFVGIENFLYIFQDSFFIQACWNTLVFFGLSIIFTFFIPIIQAIFLNEIVKGRRIFSTMYLLTAVIPMSVNVIIWKWIWHPSYGMANSILGFFGIQPSLWLSDPNLTKFAIIFPGILGGGTAVLLYLAAILNSPSEIIEASQIDGCGGWRRIFKIVIPNIKFLVLIQFVFLIITSMQLYDVPYQYASGGPVGASTSVGLYIYKTFYNDALLGRSNAAALVLFFAVAVMVFIQLKLDKTTSD